jgi:DNA polymerase
MTTLWLDCETYSECDLRTAGTHRYAEHPSTEIIVAQWATDDGDPRVLDCTIGDDAKSDPDLMELLWALRSPTVTVVAHNSHFDRTLLRHCWGFDVPVERWRDTMVQALAHGLPGALDKVGQIVGLPNEEQKDKRGRELIQLFCKPRPKGHKLRRATRETHPTEWAEFLEYGRQDIVAMRAIHSRLPTWNLREGGSELALWHLDQHINDRGFKVDVDLAESAIRAVADEQVRLKQETHDLTDGAVSSPSKRDELLVHILMEHGVSLPDMRADTLRRRMEDPELPEGVRLLLAIRLEATRTSTVKYTALMRAVSGDGRLRNTLQFAGANRTTRWAGRLFQPQNMTRPDMDAGQIALGIDALKAGCAPLLFENVMNLTANAVRGCIIAPAGRKLVVADLSNIEGRGLAYLAGEEWKVQAFRDVDAGHGHDLYKLAYARSFNVSPEDVTKGQRQIGKVQELGLGYQGGVGAFITFAAVYRMDLDEMARSVWVVADREELKDAGDMLAWTKKKRRSTFGLNDMTFTACQLLVSQWRAAHPATAALWKNMQEAVTNAIREPGATFTVRQFKVRRDGAWLRVRLPSGRYLCYTQPAVSDEGQITYMGVDQYTRQWKRIKTYGGKIVENCVQAWARDVLAANMPAVEARGYQITLTVHDELITEAIDDPHWSSDALAATMSRNPPWASDCPLSAAGFESYRYRKD